ncbi:MAG: RHS repeat-associated core domain-containing protein [Acidobacteriales bacterium]|nr:RHS repeat-associated core domain-containing protein [Terriglobales bacterium]
MTTQSLSRASLQHDLACASAQGWTNPLTFSRVHYAGYEYNGSTGLHHTWFREYGLRLGRFLQADPLGGDASDPQSLNRFAYTRNDPGNLVDPLGLSCEDPQDGQPCIVYVSDTFTPVASGSATGVGGGSDFEAVIYTLSRGGLRLIKRPLTDSEARGSDGKGGGAPANNDPCDALCQAVFHSPQAQNTWKQADCTINGPATEAIKGVADGVAADSVKGVLTARSAGTSVAKGVAASVKDGTLTFAFGIYSYVKMMAQVGWNMVMGCKGD